MFIFRWSTYCGNHGHLTIKYHRLFENNAAKSPSSIIQNYSREKGKQELVPIGCTVDMYGAAFNHGLDSHLAKVVQDSHSYHPIPSFPFKAVDSKSSGGVRTTVANLLPLFEWYVRHFGEGPASTQNIFDLRTAVSVVCTRVKTYNMLVAKHEMLAFWWNEDVGTESERTPQLSSHVQYARDANTTNSELTQIKIGRMMGDAGCPGRCGWVQTIADSGLRLFESPEISLICHVWTCSSTYPNRMTSLNYY